MVLRHHVYPCEVGHLLPRGDDGLGDEARAVVAAVEHDGYRILLGGAGGRAAGRDAGDLQHRPRLAVHERGVHGARTGLRGKDVDGLLGPGTWTTSSSSGCGVR